MNTDQYVMNELHQIENADKGWRHSRAGLSRQVAASLLASGWRKIKSQSKASLRRSSGDEEEVHEQ